MKKSASLRVGLTVCGVGMLAATPLYTGCETTGGPPPAMLGMASAGYAGMAANPSLSAQQRSVAAGMSRVMSAEAQRQHEIELARMGQAGNVTGTTEGSGRGAWLHKMGQSEIIVVLCNYWKDLNGNGKIEYSELFGVNRTFQAGDRITRVVMWSKLEGHALKSELLDGGGNRRGKDGFRVPSQFGQMQNEMVELPAGAYTILWYVDERPVLKTEFQVIGSGAQLQSHVDYSRLSVEELTAKAEKGDAAAQFVLGVSYQLGTRVSKNPVEAVKWYRKAAEQGMPEAQGNLGVCYMNGEGVPKDAAEAVKWYRKAAEQGVPNAQCDLGVCYMNGEGVPKDAAEAVKWYRKAAELGVPNAQYGLGMCYDTGEGVPKDAAEAVKWCRKAAEQGMPEAQCNLGVYYENGDGVPKDYIEAYKWTNLAAAQGVEQAKTNLDRIAKMMTPEQIAEGQRLSRDFKHLR